MPRANLVVGTDGGNSLQGTGGADLIYGFDPNGPQSQASALIATRVAAGLGQPLFVVAPPDDPNRLFIVEKTGLIKILDLATRTDSCNAVPQCVQPNPDGRRARPARSRLRSSVRQQRPLLRQPDQHERGHGDPPLPRVGATQTSPNPQARPSSPSTSRASAITRGAGSALDPTDISMPRWVTAAAEAIHLAADKTSIALLGKILRVDVHGDDFPGDPTRNYAVPADNPFVGSDGLDEIFAFGLRNPWRPSFDRGLGDFYIADVGQRPMGRDRHRPERRKLRLEYFRGSGPLSGRGSPHRRIGSCANLLL